MTPDVASSVPSASKRSSLTSTASAEPAIRRAWSTSTSAWVRNGVLAPGLCAPSATVSVGARTVIALPVKAEPVAVSGSPLDAPSALTPPGVRATRNVSPSLACPLKSYTTHRRVLPPAGAVTPLSATVAV